MRNAIVLMALLISSTPSFALTPKETCSNLQPYIKQLQEQTPVTIDYMTTATGVQAMHVGNSCIIHYNYVINTEQFIKEGQESSGLNREETIKIYQSEEGREALTESFTEIAVGAVNSSMAEFKKLKNIKIIYRYSFDTYEIQPIAAVGLDTTK